MLQAVAPLVATGPAVASTTAGFFLDHIGSITAAVGGLGTAAFGLVDASKSMFGGVSTRGLADISKVMAMIVPDVSAQGTATMLTADAAASTDTDEPPPAPATSLSSILVTVRSNWINGLAVEDQIAVAKTLVKLAVSPAMAPRLAVLTNVSPTVLAAVFAKLGNGQPLLPAESDVYARFDLVLTTLLEQAYQRASQKYRNTAKLCAGLVAVLLAVLGAFCLPHAGAVSTGSYYGRAALIGLFATPLAPIAKDLASAIQAGAGAIQVWRS